MGTNRTQTENAEILSVNGIPASGRALLSLCPRFGHKKTRNAGWVHSHKQLLYLAIIGGDGWTRTTDLSIMSAAL